MSVSRTLRAMSSAVVAGALLIGTASVAAADGVRDKQWPLKAFDAESVWKESTGKGVTVAVIDNGVNGAHPDLKGNVLPGKSFAGAGTADQEVNADHGTGMASLIAGHGHGPGGSSGIKGLAPDAKLLPIKVNDGNKEGDGSADVVAKAIRYAVDHDASVINMSIAAYSSSPADKAAVSYALKHDVLLVAGTGNAGTDSKQYPAAYPGVLAVGAVDSSTQIWEDSSYGRHVKLVAPGVSINSAGATTQYRVADGTSNATAYVSAAAALLRSKFPDLTAGQIANRLTKTALKPEGVTKLPDERYGYGTIRPLRALTEDIPKGSKYGPLEVPKGDESGGDGAPGSEPNDQVGEEQGGMSPVLIGAVAAGALLVIIVVIVLVSRSNRRNGPPPGGGHGGYGPPGAPVYPPQQPNPYQQSAPPGSYPPGPPQR